MTCVVRHTQVGNVWFEKDEMSGFYFASHFVNKIHIIARGKTVDEALEDFERQVTEWYQYSPETLRLKTGV
jgi:hypothetical protein